MTGTRQPLLRVEGLSKTFRQGDSLLNRLLPGQNVTEVHAVDNVDLTVYQGDTLGLVGESGCGKSTLARTILQLIEPTEGDVYYRNRNLTELSGRELKEFRSEAQMIFQDPNSSLNPRYSVRKTLIEPMEVHGVGDSKEERIERARYLLDRVGLGKEAIDRYPHEFSGGQRQRIGIARALAVDPQLVVADEPVSALDVSIQAQILDLLDELRREMNLTMIFISHNLSVVRYICDRVAIMYLGNIVETADASEFFASPKHPYTQSLISSVPIPNPAIDRERIHLEGDVPTPIDPPSGCRFHTRCPKVIPPDNWPDSDEAWRRVLQLKTRIENDMIRADSIRELLEDQGDERVTEETIVQYIYEENVTKRSTDAATTVSLSRSTERVVLNAIETLVAGDPEAAMSQLDEKYTTICKYKEPEQIVERLDRTEHMVKCHLYDEAVDQTPTQTTSL